MLWGCIHAYVKVHIVIQPFILLQNVNCVKKVCGVDYCYCGTFCSEGGQSSSDLFNKIRILLAREHAELASPPPLYS